MVEGCRPDKGGSSDSTHHIPKRTQPLQCTHTHIHRPWSTPLHPIVAVSVCVCVLTCLLLLFQVLKDFDLFLQILLQRRPRREETREAGATLGELRHEGRGREGVMCVMEDGWRVMSLPVWWVGVGWAADFWLQRNLAKWTNQKTPKNRTTKRQNIKLYHHTYERIIYPPYFVTFLFPVPFVWPFRAAQ